MKICSKCKKAKPKTMFSKNRLKKDGLRYECKNCQSIAGKKYRKTPKGEIVARKSSKRYLHTFRGHLQNRWTHMNFRTKDTKYKGFHRYGGRGIKNLFKSFDAFFKYVTQELGYVSIEELENLQIDRINNSGHYEPGNIHFVTSKVNNNNKG